MWRNYPPAEEPFLPSPLCELLPALTNTGPVQEGSALGKCRPRISCGLSASHLSTLPLRFRHGEGGRVLADPAAALPPTAICRALEGHKDDICPSKPSPRLQKQKGIYETALLSRWCTYATEGVNIYIGYIYRISHCLHGTQTVWNKLSWLDVKKKRRRVAAFLFPGHHSSNQQGQDANPNASELLGFKRASPLLSQGKWHQWLMTLWAIFLSLLYARLHVAAKVTASYLLRWGLPPTSKQGRGLSGQSGRTSCKRLGVGGNLAAFYLGGKEGVLQKWFQFLNLKKGLRCSNYLELKGTPHVPALHSKLCSAKPRP